MLPHRPHNYAHSPNSYQFDMRVNVDFATGHVQLGLPQNAPFAQKSLANLPQTMPFTPAPIVPRSSPHLPLHQPAPQPVEPVDRHSLSGLSDSHSSVKAGLGRPQLMEHTMPVFHQVQPPHQEHSTVGQVLRQEAPVSRKTPSLTSTYNCDQSIQAVQCVICEKLIDKDNFKQHLQDHRKRRMNKRNETVSQISIRNQNSEAEARQLLKNATFNRSSIKTQQQVHSQGSVLSHPSNILSHPSQVAYQQQQPSQSQFYLSQSSSYQQPILPQQVLVMGGQDISVGPSDQMFIDQSAGSYWVNSTSKQIPTATHLSPKKLTYQKIDSIIVRKPAQNIFDECGQSFIEPNSHLSRQSSIGEIRKHLKQSQVSSQEEISLRAQPAYSYNSAGLPAWKVKSRQSLSDKLSHTKVPVNFLAHEEFMSSSGSLQGSASKGSK